MNKGTTKLTLISILVISLSVMLAATLAYLTPAQTVQAGASMENLVAEGRLPGYEEADINEDGSTYFFYQICKEVTFNKPGAPGRVLIENTTGNQCAMQVEYQLAQGGQVIYTSPMIQPGQHVIEDRLGVELKKGTYDVIAKITAYDIQTNKVMRNDSENITVIVKNKLF